MNIAVRHEVTGVLIFLPVGEAQEFVKNPRRAQEEVAAMLKGTASLRQDEDVAFARLVLRDDEKLALPAPSASAGGRKGARGRWGRKAGSPVNCPECGKPMKNATGLAGHRSKMHGVAGKTKAAKVAREAKAQAGQDVEAERLAAVTA